MGGFAIFSFLSSCQLPSNQCATIQSLRTIRLSSLKTHLAVDECVTEAVNNIAVVDFQAEEPVSGSGYIWS